MKKIVPYGDLTRSTGGKGWISFGQIYLGFGKIYVNACSGGDAGRSDNNYGLQPEKTSIKIFKVNSDGSTVRVYNNSESPFDTCDTNSVPADERKEVEFGKAEGIEAGSHTYRIEMSGIDSHDGSHSATIEGIPAPPPPPGPILTLENKTGHFRAIGSVQLEFNMFDTPETSNANSAVITINGAVSNFLPTEFPVTETVSGFRLHTVKFEGISDDGDKSVIDYSFSIGTNDWSPNLLTPVKTIRHVGEDIGGTATHNPYGVINLYSKNSVITQRTFQDLFGSGHTIYGNANSTVTFSTAFAGDQIDAQNTFNKFVASSDTLPNTYIKFDDVMNFPARNDLMYFAQAPGVAVDHEISLFIACVNTFNVRDECDIPPPVELNFDLRSTPNANGDYEFTAAGLTAEAQVLPNGHSHHQQYYHVHYPDTDTHSYSRIDDNLLTAISLNPSANDTKLVLELFNSCGTKVSKTFDIEFISGGGSIGPIVSGGSASGSAVTIVESATTGSRPNYHSLIVVR